MTNRKLRIQSAPTHPMLCPGRPPRYSFMTITALFCSIILGGCAYVSTFPLNELPDKSGPILSGPKDTQSVRSTLGDPLLASRYWGVELYRQAASQTETPMALFIPVGKIKDDIYRYTLVSYDKDRLAHSAAAGIWRRPSAWRTASPIEYNYLSIQLQASDVTFVAEWEDRHETLLVSPARRDAYLEEARSSSQSTVVIGCGTRECSDSLTIDGGPSLPLPCRLKVTNIDQNALDLLYQGKQKEYERLYPTTQYDAVAALRLPPGSHTLEASGGHWNRGQLAGRLSGGASLQVSCRPGEILYVVIDVFPKQETERGAKDFQWKIDSRTDMPPFFKDRPLAIYRGGKWLADPEPAPGTDS